MNCAVLFFCLKQTVRRVKNSFSVLAVHKEHWNIVPLLSFQKTSQSQTSSIFIIFIIFLLISHFFVDRGRTVDVCLFGLEPL